MHFTLTWKSAVFIIIVMILASGCVTKASQEVKYKDPKNKGNYIIFNRATNSFYANQTSGNCPGGTFSETSESFSLKYDDPLKYGFGDTVKKQGNDAIITPKNETWVREK